MHPAIAQLAADRTSGATALVMRAIGILQGVSGERSALEAAARDLCRAQPSMGGMHTAAALALSAPDPSAALAALTARVARGPAAIARVAGRIVALRRGSEAVRIVTCSRSAAVEATLLGIGRTEPVSVACSESRPALEGVGLAARLAASGIPTALYSDAGLACAIGGADALVVGADALAAGGFINKVGTSALCALAAAEGVPVFVLAGREKIVPDMVFAGLPLREGQPDEIGVPPGLYTIRNPYFERIAWPPVAQVVADAGELHPSQLVTATIWSDRMIREYMSVIR